MCQVCEGEFIETTRSFDEFLRGHLEEYKAGGLMDTPAQRVHDLAQDYIEMYRWPRGHYMVSCWLAIALERLVALESIGIPVVAEP